MSFQGEGSTGNNTDSSEMLQAIRKTNGLLGEVKALMKTEFHKVFKGVDDFRKKEFDSLQCLESLFDILFKNDEPMYLIQEWQLIKGSLHAVMDRRKGIENNLDNAADLMAKALKELKSKMDESNFKMLSVAAQKRVVKSFKLYEADLLQWKAECEQVLHFWNHNKEELMTSLMDCNERANQFLLLIQNSQRED
ncbi:unnamed protein product [Orchesella dallaii]|uniref:Uncharacterized protein n=1 Tax=Orchesella dallaii TaxID=48710 RepID=A0ABP1R534_9HEXA